MRGLTVSQKKLLLNWIKTQTNLTYSWSSDNLPSELWEKLQLINDTEILWQEVNRFVRDNIDKQKKSTLWGSTSWN